MQLSPRLSWRRSRLLWPSVMTVVMMIVLLGLGTWQVQRLFWKEAILAQIDRAEAADPVPLTTVLSGSGASPFMKVSATGQFLPDEVALYGADVRTIPSGPEMGARMIEPLKQPNGDVVLVDRGWIPISRPGPIEQPDGAVTVTGYLRPGDTQHWWSARDNPVERRFFTLDPKAIGEAVGQPNVLPYILVVLAPSRLPPQGLSEDSEQTVKQWPAPAGHLPRPPNSHLSYAMTWYGLAIALLAIFIVWARKGPLS